MARYSIALVAALVSISLFLGADFLDFQDFTAWKILMFGLVLGVCFLHCWHVLKVERGIALWFMGSLVSGTLLLLLFKHMGRNGFFGWDFLYWEVTFPVGVMISQVLTFIGLNLANLYRRKR